MFNLKIIGWEIGAHVKLIKHLYSRIKTYEGPIFQDQNLWRTLIPGSKVLIFICNDGIKLNWSLATNSTLKYQRCPLLNYKDIQWEPEKWGIGRRLFDSSLTLNSTMIVRHCSCAVWTDLFPLLSDLIIF